MSSAATNARGPFVVGGAATNARGPIVVGGAATNARGPIVVGGAATNAREPIVVGGAATNAREPNFASAAAANALESIFPMVQAGPSTTTYSRDEIDDFEFTVNTCMKTMEALGAEVDRIVPLNSFIGLFTYIQDMDLVDVLPFICESEFWTAVNYQSQIHRTWIIFQIMPLVLRDPANPAVSYKVMDERNVQNVDAVLRAALRFKAGIGVVRLLVAMCPFVITHPNGKMRLLAAHDALMHGCGLDVIIQLTNLSAIFRHRDACGRTLLHWAVLCDAPFDIVQRLFEQFPQAVDCPSFPLNGGDIDASYLPGTKLDILRGGEQEMRFSGGCTPLCLALDLNMRNMPPRHNSQVIKFLVHNTKQACLVVDATGEIAFHKLLKGSYGAREFKDLVWRFIERHASTAQCTPFVKDRDGLVLLELAFRLRLPPDIIDLLGRFTSNMVEPVLSMINIAQDANASQQPDVYRDKRPWSFAVHPFEPSDYVPTMPSGGLPFMCSNDGKSDHLSDVVTCFIWGEDAVLASYRLFEEGAFRDKVHQTPMRYRKWTQLVQSKTVWNRFKDDLLQLFPKHSCTFRAVLRHLQRSQKTWYARYKRERRVGHVGASDPPFLSEHDASLFFAQRDVTSPLNAEREPAREDSSEKNASDLLKLLEDENASETAAKSTPGRKARATLAKKQREQAEEESRALERDALEVATAIAQAGAAIVRERLQMEEVAAKRVAALLKARKKQEDLAIASDKDTSREVDALEAEMHRLELEFQTIRDRRVNMVFSTMRETLLLAQQEIVDAAVLQYATDLIVREMIAVVEAESVMNRMLQPHLRDQLQYGLPGFTEREAAREADRLELEALRAIVKDEREARECVICMSNPRNVLLQPCMHIPICNVCNDLSPPVECPICRTAVASATVVFL